MVSCHGVELVLFAVCCYYSSVINFTICLIVVCLLRLFLHTLLVGMAKDHRVYFTGGIVGVRAEPLAIFLRDAL